MAVRDNESRLRFAGYQPVTFKVFVFVLGAVLAALGGMLVYAAEWDYHAGEDECAGVGDAGGAGGGGGAGDAVWGGDWGDCGELSGEYFDDEVAGVVAVFPWGVVYRGDAVDSGWDCGGVAEIAGGVMRGRRDG